MLRMTDAASCFPPAAPAETRVLILGSLPGRQSLARQQYYGHPQNQFWRLLGDAVGCQLHTLDYLEKLRAVNERGIGLWDVVANARRPGSLDHKMRDIEPNALAGFVASLPQLQAIAFNGLTASRIGRRQLGDSGEAIRLIDLPSSSPAYTLAYAKKAEIWGELACYASSPHEGADRGSDEP
jgi:hypoxanthine-DNA glycosylase